MSWSRSHSSRCGPSTTVYSFVDQPHARLARGSHFLLWAMRCWVLCNQRGRCPVASMARSFSKIGLSGALRDFDALMLALDQLAGRHMAFADHGHVLVTESEAVMLALWSDVGERQIDRAHATLVLLVPAADAEGIMARLETIAGQMARIGLTPTRTLKMASSTADDRDEL